MSNRRWIIVFIVATFIAWLIGLGSHRAGAQQWMPVPGDCEGGVCQPQQPATPFSQPPQWGQQQQQPTGPQVPPIVPPTSEAIVRIWSTEGSQSYGGSGVLIWKDETRGIIASCAHTFDGHGDQATVVFKSGQVYDGRVLHMDRVGDLSIVEIAAPSNVEPLAIAETKPQVGESLAIAGYGSGVFAVMRGRVLQYLAYSNNGYNQLPDAMELATPARQGDSGGPILNSRHEVVGIICAASDRTANGPHCESLRRFLDRFFPKLRKRQDGPPAGSSTPLPLEPVPVKPGQQPPAAAPAQPIQPNDEPHPDAAKNGEAPKWEPGGAPQVNTPDVEQPDKGIIGRAKDRVIERVGLTLLEKLLLMAGLSSGPATAGAIVAWKAFRWWRGRKKQPAAAEASGSVPQPPPPPVCRYREPSAPLPPPSTWFDQTPLQRPAEPLKPGRSQAEVFLEAENQRLHAELSKAMQPVMYRQAPIGDNLPAFRQAMKLASDTQPHLRHAVKFFEDTFKVQQAGDLTHA